MLQAQLLQITCKVFSPGGVPAGPHVTTPGLVWPRRGWSRKEGKLLGAGDEAWRDLEGPAGLKGKAFCHLSISLLGIPPNSGEPGRTGTVLSVCLHRAGGAKRLAALICGIKE